MSAWVVEREHVDVIVRYARCARGVYWQSDEGDWREMRDVTDTELGRMLAEENIASVCYRYEDDTADMYEDMIGYTYRDPGYTLTDREALKAIGCLEYQSCEHPGWEESEAKRFLQALEAYAVGQLYEGPWGWDAGELAKRPKSYPIFR